MTQNKILLFLIVLIAILLIALIGTIIFLGDFSTVDATAVKETLLLPSEAQKLSDVIPQMGEHWGNPAQLEAQGQAGKPMGPIYMLYQGEVIGVEYMWTEDALQEVPGPPGETIKVLPYILPVGVTVDHIDVGWMTPDVHEGPPVDHWEMHIYFITPEEKAAITPGG